MFVFYSWNYKTQTKDRNDPDFSGILFGVGITFCYPSYERLGAVCKQQLIMRRNGAKKKK